MYAAIFRRKEAVLIFEQFVSTRPNTPLLIRGKPSRTFSQDDIAQNGKANGGLSIPRPNGAPKSGPDAISVLEAKANGM